MHKLMDGEDLQRLTDRQLGARRRRLVASLERLDATLPGSLVRQGRPGSRSPGRIRRGERHRPYP
jgi:hypothetical protein